MTTNNTNTTTTTPTTNKALPPCCGCSNPRPDGGCDWLTLLGYYPEEGWKMTCELSSQVWVEGP